MKDFDKDNLKKIADELDAVMLTYLNIILHEAGPKGLLAVMVSTGTTLLGSALILTKLETVSTEADISQLLTTMLRQISDRALDPENINTMREALIQRGVIGSPYTCQPSH